MRPLGRSLFHPGEIPQLGRHLPLAYREQDVSSQFVERRGPTPQLEWGPIEVGQSHPEGQAGALCARICEVARMLGYNAAKTKMLVGQWRLDLVGLERKLQHELDEGPQIPGLGKRDKRLGRQN
jgi:hypothetical protein